MTKFKGPEQWVLLLTLVFLLSTIGWFFYQNREQENTRISVVHVDREEAVHPNETNEEAPGILEGEQININTAPIEDLVRLPGIGEVRAGHIVDFRELHGPFQTKEDIMQVSGIGPKTYEKLAEYIKVIE